MLLEMTTFLGPARVLDVLDSRVALELSDRTVWATLAVTGGYVPVAGDLVLAIGGDEAFYVIGVLLSTGPTTVKSNGDLNIVAANGIINLMSTRGISARSPSMRFHTNRLEFI